MRSVTTGQDRASDLALGLFGSCAIGVMAKSPRPGFSKTRLCPPLRPEHAARLSAAFLRDTTESVLTAAGVAPITGYAAYAPAGTEALLAPHLAPGTRQILADGAGPMPPGVDGFGRSLLHAIQGQFAQGHSAACVLSSDVPTLPSLLLAQAARSLLSGGPRRVVLGACDDGGYYLLGMRQVHPGLFTDIAWSTDTVAATTRLRAAQLGLELIELPPWYDVDDATALARLVRETEDGGCARWTRRALDALGLTAFGRAHSVA
ncbi:MAG: hypothetical protein BGO51_27570 [Rhodospirillales bacterium 69-11]|nr:glycosyltransferase [Rhodospirillales bacterium]MBN8929991.1 glycosyltransferase [Rhodospirillales bacterium]OJW19128.1 MAG: hypothetical protein BGO51_27570 [Rhodospirillales bacterium 69-11]